MDGQTVDPARHGSHGTPARREEAKSRGVDSRNCKPAYHKSPHVMYQDQVAMASTMVAEGITDDMLRTSFDDDRKGQRTTIQQHWIKRHVDALPNHNGPFEVGQLV